MIHRILTAIVDWWREQDAAAAEDRRLRQLGGDIVPSGREPQTDEDIDAVNRFEAGIC